MYRIFVVILMIGALAVQIVAQETPETTPEITPEATSNPAPDGDLVVEDMVITAGRDVFGQIVRQAQGQLVNRGTMAYQNITLFAEIYDESSGELIGEGLGFLVDACGTGMLPDFALQPDESRAFDIVLELFEDGIDIGKVEVFPEGMPVDPEPVEELREYTGIERVSEREVVDVEWMEPAMLRYGVGCDSDVFTNLEWFSYNLDTGVGAGITHPNASQVTDALLQQLGLTDPQLYNRSFLTFPLNTRRILYQNELNSVLSAEPDGSFKRLIYDDLSRRSLQGFLWLPQSRFLAYYFGAFGEDVYYFTASVEGQRVSVPIHDALPSLTVPGATPDGARAVITTTVDGVTGYYLKNTIFEDIELLFQAEPPGNNWPAPIYVVDEADQAYVYIVRPVGGEPLLQCYDRQTQRLNTLSALPLRLNSESRAWTWLSPDRNTVALAANGVDGGLWLIDLTELGKCSLQLQG